MRTKRIDGGEIRGRTFYKTVTSENNAFYMDDELLDMLTDEGVMFLVFIDPAVGRFTISVTEWVDNSTLQDDGSWSVPRSKMVRG